MLVAKHRIDPKLTAEIGRKIYEERYRQSLEPTQNGKFLAIDVETGLASLGDNANQAMDAARQAVPGGWYFLMRVGHPAAFVIY
jgi:hypothetical protein